MAKKLHAEDKQAKLAERKRKPVAMGALIGQQVNAVAPESGIALAKLRANWAAMCPLLCRWSVPLEFHTITGVLKVAVASDAVKQELLYMTPQLVSMANSLLGYEAVERLMAVTKHGVGDAKDGAKKAFPKLAPPQAAVDKAAEQCHHVRDDELRDALVKLGAWVQADKKG